MPVLFVLQIVTKPRAKFLMFSCELFLELQATLSQKMETFPSAQSKKWWGLPVADCRPDPGGKRKHRVASASHCPRITRIKPASHVECVVCRSLSSLTKVGNSLTLTDGGPDHSALGFNTTEQVELPCFLWLYAIPPLFFFFRIQGDMVGCFIATGTLEKLKSLAIFSRGYFSFTHLILCPVLNYLQTSQALCQSRVAVTRSGWWG